MSYHTLKYTLCRRVGGSWAQSEISRIVNHFYTEVIGIGTHPEYIAVLGERTAWEVMTALGGFTEAIGDGDKFAVSVVTYDELPWNEGISRRHELGWHDRNTFEKVKKETDNAGTD